MSAKNSKYKPKSFEGVGTKFRGMNNALMADTSANIFESMLQSDSFKKLPTRQKVLYVYCKAQYYGKRKPKYDYRDIEDFQSDECFYFSWHAAQLYGLYKPTCASNFYKDIDGLIDSGFIDRVTSGKTNRAKSVYKYSDRWRGS